MIQQNKSFSLLTHATHTDILPFSAFYTRSPMVFFVLTVLKGPSVAYRSRNALCHVDILISQTSINAAPYMSEWQVWSKVLAPRSQLTCTPLPYLGLSNEAGSWERCCDVAYPQWWVTACVKTLVMGIRPRRCAWGNKTWLWRVTLVVQQSADKESTVSNNMYEQGWKEHEHGLLVVVAAAASVVVVVVVALLWRRLQRTD